MAAAHTLAWLVAMWPDFGRLDPTESPMMWTLGTVVDSKVARLTVHQLPALSLRALSLRAPASAQTSPARCLGTTFSTSPLTSSNSVETVILLPSTASGALLGR